jgi:Transposase IS116/IS110/IS902 family
LAELATIIRDERGQRLPATARAALMPLVRRIASVSAQMAALDSALRKENNASELGPRLETIPSVRPVIASALRARVTDAKLFENGRHLAAWIGIVPENDSTGGKVKQKGLSKKGDRNLRSLLINGAMAVVQQAQKRPDKHPWVAKLLGRMSAKQAAIAIVKLHGMGHVRLGDQERILHVVARKDDPVPLLSRDQQCVFSAIAEQYDTTPGKIKQAAGCSEASARSRPKTLSDTWSASAWSPRIQKRMV